MGVPPIRAAFESEAEFDIWSQVALLSRFGMTCSYSSTVLISLIRLSRQLLILLLGRIYILMRDESYIVADENIPDVQIDVAVKDTEEENKRICTMIRKIIARGNDAEVKRKGDGSITVYEVKKNKVTG